MDDKEKLQTCIEALKELVTPKGAFRLDRMEHAEETIKETALIAKSTLIKIGEIEDE